MRKFKNQWRVIFWICQLKINPGQLTTYSQIAESIQNAKLARAVGTAIGSNSIAFLIPCHRVVPKTGIIGEYRWGTARKMALIGWEAANINSTINY